MKINGIIGKKLGMSLIYDDSGNALPVTLVQAGPCTVTQVKTESKDGYDSVQVGFSESKRINSPQKGHQKRSGGQFSILQEFAAEDFDQIEVGQEITTEIFEEDTKIKKTHGLLNNKTFMLTGKLKGMSRAEAKSLIEQHSGNIISNISKKLDYLIIGEKPTKRKIDTAKDLKIKILDQKGWLKMLD